MFIRRNGDRSEAPATSGRLLCRLSLEAYVQTSAGSTGRICVQADELDRLVPELAPSALPTTCVAERDLLALADREGGDGCQALLEASSPSSRVPSSSPPVRFIKATASITQVLAAAGEEVEDCSICGEPGEIVIDPEAQDSEAVALRVMLVCRLQFLDKTLLPTKCQVVCDNLGPPV